MNRIRKSQLHMILAIMLVAIFLLCLYAGIRYEQPMLNPISKGTSTMNEAWIVTVSGDYDMSVDLPCHLEVKTNEPVSISHFLPKDLEAGASISFYSFYNVIQVQVGEDVIYQYGESETRPFLKAPVPKWHLVSLPEYSAGEKLTITQYSPYAQYTGRCSGVRLGNYWELLLEELKGQLAGVCLFVILLGIVFALLVVLKASGGWKYRREATNSYLLLVGIFGVWLLAGNTVFQTYFGLEYLGWTLKNFSVFGLVMAYMLLMKEFVPNRRQGLLLDVGMIANAICFLIVAILQVLGLMDAPQLMPIYEGALKVLFVAYTLFLGYGFLREKEKKSLPLFLVNVALILSILVNTVFNHSQYVLTDTMGQFILCLYMLGLLFAVIPKESAYLRQQLKQITHGEVEQRKKAVTLLNPNFLFSCLNSLLTLVKRNAPGAPQFVYAFSQYLRYNLDYVRGETLVEFKEELQHAKAYLDMQQMRYGDLRVQIEDKITDFQVPNRVIEALVENGVKHGLEKRDYKGSLIIRSYARRDCIAVQIVDDGVGFDVESLYRKNTPTGSKRLRERLQEIGAQMEVSSRREKGTIVTLKFPKEK